jgi:hypothetical protein
MEPDERHGDERHITLQDVVDAAEANDEDVAATWRTMAETFRRVQDGSLESEAWSP